MPPGSGRGSGGHGSWNVECKVYVGGLAPDETAATLYKLFLPHGHVKNVWVARNPPGFGFVEMGTRRSALSACDALHGSVLMGKKIRVEMSTGMTKMESISRRNTSQNWSPSTSPSYNRCRDSRCSTCSRFRSYSRSFSRSRSRSYSPYSERGGRGRYHSPYSRSPSPSYNGYSSRHSRHRRYRRRSRSTSWSSRSSINSVPLSESGRDYSKLRGQSPEVCRCSCHTKTKRMVGTQTRVQKLNVLMNTTDYIMYPSGRTSIQNNGESTQAGTPQGSDSAKPQEGTASQPAQEPAKPNGIIQKQVKQEEQEEQKETVNEASASSEHIDTSGTSGERKASVSDDRPHEMSQVDKEAQLQEEGGGSAQEEEEQSDKEEEMAAEVDLKPNTASNTSDSSQYNPLVNSEQSCEVDIVGRAEQKVSSPIYMTATTATVPHPQTSSDTEFKTDTHGHGVDVEHNEDAAEESGDEWTEEEVEEEVEIEVDDTDGDVEDESDEEESDEEEAEEVATPEKKLRQDPSDVDRTDDESEGKEEEDEEFEKAEDGKGEEIADEEEEEEEEEDYEEETEEEEGDEEQEEETEKDMEESEEKEAEVSEAVMVEQAEDEGALDVPRQPAADRRDKEMTDENQNVNVKVQPLHSLSINSAMEGSVLDVRQSSKDNGDEVIRSRERKDSVGSGGFRVNESLEFNESNQHGQLQPLADKGHIGASDLHAVGESGDAEEYDEDEYMEIEEEVEVEIEVEESEAEEETEEVTDAEDVEKVDQQENRTEVLKEANEEAREEVLEHKGGKEKVVTVHERKDVVKETKQGLAGDEQPGATDGPSIKPHRKEYKDAKRKQQRKGKSPSQDTAKRQHQLSPNLQNPSHKGNSKEMKGEKVESASPFVHERKSTITHNTEAATKARINVREAPFKSETKTKQQRRIEPLEGTQKSKTTDHPPEQHEVVVQKKNTRKAVRAMDDGKRPKQIEYIKQGGVSEQKETPRETPKETPKEHKKRGAKAVNKRKETNPADKTKGGTNPLEMKKRATKPLGMNKEGTNPLDVKKGDTNLLDVTKRGTNSSDLKKKHNPFITCVGLSDATISAETKGGTKARATKVSPDKASVESNIKEKKNTKKATASRSSKRRKFVESSSDDDEPLSSLSVSGTCKGAKGPTPEKKAKNTRKK